MATRFTSTTTRTTVVFQSVRRKRKDWQKVLIRGNRITASSDGLNDRFIEAPIQFTAEAIDVNFDDIGHAFPVGIPDVFAQHLAGDDLAGMAHHELEKAEFRRAE